VLEGDPLEALGDEGAEALGPVHRQAAGLHGRRRVPGAAPVEVAVAEAGLEEPAQADAHGLGGGGRRGALGAPHAQAQEQGVGARRLQDLEGVGRAHRRVRAGLQDEHLEGLVGAPIALQEGGGDGNARGRRAAEGEEGGQERLAHLEAEATPVAGHGVEAPHHRAAPEDVLARPAPRRALDRLLGRGRRGAPARRGAGDEREDGQRRQRERRAPDPPPPGGLRASLRHHRARQL
jgi:hypothetical protein